MGHPGAASPPLLSNRPTACLILPSYIQISPTAAFLPLQVAYGLLQFLSSLGGSGAADAADGPAGLNAMLQAMRLPPNPLKKAMHTRMDRDPTLFLRRPMDDDVVQYAGPVPLLPLQRLACE